MADWSTCPASHGPARDAWILNAVRNGEAQYDWTEIEIIDPQENSMIISVFSEMLKIGGIRVNVSAKLQQQIADVLVCRLMTARISDLAWLSRALTLPPYSRPITSTTAAMIEQSQKIDAEIAKRGGAPLGIIATEGKDWVLDNVLVQKPNKAANYGWHFEGNWGGKAWSPSASIPGVRVVQPVSTWHDSSHVDYSQCCRLVSRGCIYNGQAMDLDVALKDAFLSKFVSAQGPLKLLRQPGVPDALTGAMCEPGTECPVPPPPPVPANYPPPPTPLPGEEPPADEGDEGSSGSSGKVVLVLGALSLFGAILYANREKL